MSQSKVQLVSNIVGNVSGGASFTGIVTASSFYGDGSNLSNTGSTLAAASGSQRLVVTSQTTGTMTSVGTDADLVWDSTTNTLSSPTFSGNITGTAATFAGNVSIAGTLTYEDVTNVDSIGIVTARSGVIINSGGLQVTGVTTVAAGSTSAPSITPTGDNNTGIFFPSPDTIAFGEGGAEAARIDSSGRFAMGTSSPNVDLKLSVNGGGGFGDFVSHISNKNLQVKFYNTGDSSQYIGLAAEDSATAGVDGNTFKVFRQASAVERARITPEGGFSVGTTANPGAGAIYATGDITAFYSSDIRLKKDIQPISEPIKKLMEISGVTYKWNEEYLKDKDVDGYFVRETEVGVIAQDVEKVLPEVVATRENGYKAVRYEKLVALLIEAVKDQQKQIDELKARLEEV